MQLSALTDTELLRHARAQFDPLTSTEIEAELIKRLEDLLPGVEACSRVLQALDDAGVDVDDNEDLQRVAAVMSSLDDLADPIAKLSRLANSETTATEGAN